MAKVYYFQHDFLARQDPKLLAVQKAFGLEGLGFYWCVVEYLYEQGGTLDLKSVEPFAYQMHFDEKKARSIINDFGLFEKDKTSFWSPSIMRRLNKMSEIAAKRRIAAKNRWNKADQPEPEVKPEKTKEDPIDYEAIVSAFHECCPSLSSVQKLTDSRRKKMKTRIKEMGSIESMKDVFRRVEASDFCKGENKSGWKADFDWIIANDSNWQKIMSGRYDNRSKQTKEQQKKEVNNAWK